MRPKIKYFKKIIIFKKKKKKEKKSRMRRRRVRTEERTHTVGGGRALWQRENGRGNCGWKGVWV